MVKQWQGGLTGADMEREDADLRDIGRLDESWPEDEGGNKVSLPPTIASTINRMPPGIFTQRGGQDDPAVDPAVSKKQYRAMQAAAHGHSTLGIPQSVGHEYVGATKNPKALPERKS